MFSANLSPRNYCPTSLVPPYTFPYQVLKFFLWPTESNCCCKYVHRCRTIYQNWKSMKSHIPEGKIFSFCIQIFFSVTSWYLYKFYYLFKSVYLYRSPTSIITIFCLFYFLFKTVLLKDYNVVLVPMLPVWFLQSSLLTNMLGTVRPSVAERIVWLWLKLFSQLV